MKRLNCTFEEKKDKVYPWLLKHPKIKVGLAKFKTRQDALEWYMSLDFETAIWFQNDEKIFGGQLTIDEEGKKFYNYIKTAGFDGGETYTGMCSELHINPKTFKHERSGYSKWLENLDFVLLHNPQTYFPPELEIAKKTSRKDIVDVEALQSKIEELNEQLQEKTQEINSITLNTEKCVFAYYPELNNNDVVGGVALYNDKLKTIIKHSRSQRICEQDYKRIVNNFVEFERHVDAIVKKPNFSNKKIIKKLFAESVELHEKLMNKLTSDGRLRNEESNFAYYRDPVANKRVSISYETSFVLLDIYHVAFVPREKYEYEMPENVVRTKYAIAVINDDEFESLSGVATSTTKKTVKTTKTTKTAKKSVETKAKKVEKKTSSKNIIEDAEAVAYAEAKDVKIASKQSDEIIEDAATKNAIYLKNKNNYEHARGKTATKEVVITEQTVDKKVDKKEKEVKTTKEEPKSSEKTVATFDIIEDVAKPVAYTEAKDVKNTSKQSDEIIEDAATKDAIYLKDKNNYEHAKNPVILTSYAEEKTKAEPKVKEENTSLVKDKKETKTAIVLADDKDKNANKKVSKWNGWLGFLWFLMVALGITLIVILILVFIQMAGGIAVFNI